MKVTNQSAHTWDFPAAGGKIKDGVHDTVSIAPGETKTLDVVGSAKAKVQAFIAMGVFSASDKDVERATAAISSPDAEPEKPKRK